MDVSLPLRYPDRQGHRDNGDFLPFARQIATDPSSVGSHPPDSSGCHVVTLGNQFSAIASVWAILKSAVSIGSAVGVFVRVAAWLAD